MDVLFVGGKFHLRKENMPCHASYYHSEIYCEIYIRKFKRSKINEVLETFFVLNTFEEKEFCEIIEELELKKMQAMIELFKKGCDGSYEEKKKFLLNEGSEILKKELLKIHFNKKDIEDPKITDITFSYPNDRENMTVEYYLGDDNYNSKILKVVGCKLQDIN